MRKEGKIYKYKDLEVQAVDGTVRLININDKYEGTNKQEQRIALSDWRDRILSITRGCQYYAEREESLNTAEKESYKEMKKMQEIGMAVFREARDQGDPLDPKVAEARLQEFRDSLKHNIILPNE
jgi:hypothetical protein